MFRDINELKSTNRQNGYCFFDESTMSFWESTIESELVSGEYFITSETSTPDVSDHRRYTIRRAESDGAVRTESEFLEFETEDDAREALERMIDSEN